MGNKKIKFKSGFTNADIYKSYVIMTISLLPFALILLILLFIIIAIIGGFINAYNGHDYIRYSIGMFLGLVFIIILLPPLSIIATPIAASSMIFARWYFGRGCDYSIYLKDKELCMDFIYPITPAYKRSRFGYERISNKIPVAIIKEIKPCAENNAKSIFSNIPLWKLYRNPGILYYPGISEDRILEVILSDGVEFRSFNLMKSYPLQKIKSRKTKNVYVDIDPIEWPRLKKKIKMIQKQEV